MVKQGLNLSRPSKHGQPEDKENKCRERGSGTENHIPAHEFFNVLKEKKRKEKIAESHNVF